MAYTGLDIYNQVKKVPDTAKRQIQAGRLKGFTDINPMWRIKCLTQMFGPCGTGWYTEATNKWKEEMPNGEILCFVDINLYYKVDNGWSAPVRGTGGSKLAAKEAKGIYYDDEGYKKAETDAIGNACKSLGIGADVWWSSDRTKYTSAPQDSRQTASNNNPAPTPEEANAEMIKNAGNELIDDIKVRTIKNVISQKGLAPNSILQYYKHTAFEEMTNMEFKNAMDLLNKYPDKEKGA